MIPPAWATVWICPIENGHIQAVGRDARKRKQYRYHPRYREARDETKFNRMVEFGAVLPAGLPQRKVVAAIVALLDKTCIRVGNDEYAKSNKSYGLTTLKDQHVNVRGASMHLHFRGKSKQDHDITLIDRRLEKIVKARQDLPGQELFQYKTGNGESVKLDSAEVYPLCPRDHAEVKRNITQAVKETAKHLAVFDSYVEKDNFPAIQKTHAGASKHGNGLGPVEAAVLRLIQSRKQRKAS